MFMFHHLGRDTFDFTRIALNIDQVEQYNPPSNPAKVTDSRFAQYQQKYGDESWELDALDPLVIRELIETKVGELRDEKLWDTAVAAQEADRATLEKVSEQWDEVVENLS